MTDGWTARKLNLISSFDAKPDTIADCVFVIVVLVKVLPAVSVPEWLRIWIAVIALIKLINPVSSLVMLHRIVPMHTAMNKVTGFMLFLLPFGIGRDLWSTFVIAATAACFNATFAAIQEGHYIRTGKEID